MTNPKNVVERAPAYTAEDVALLAFFARESIALVTCQFINDMGRNATADAVLRRFITDAHAALKKFPKGGGR